MVVIDAVARLVPGVLGAEESLLGDSFVTDQLGHPQYTRPAEYRGLRVPEVLLSGNHQQIEAWRPGPAADAGPGRCASAGAVGKGVRKRER